MTDTLTDNLQRHPAAAVVIIAGIAALLVYGMWQLRQERLAIEAKERERDERLAHLREHGTDLAPITEVHPPDEIRPLPARWLEGGAAVTEVLRRRARLVTGDEWAFIPSPQWLQERSGGHPTAAGPGHPSEAAIARLDARLAALEAANADLLAHIARLESEAELTGPPSEVARIIRDRGPIDAPAIADALGRTTIEVDEEARRLAVPRQGPGRVTAWWPKVDLDEIWAGTVHTDRPMWVWTAHAAELGVDPSPLGPVDWDALASLVDDLTPEVRQ